MVWVGLISIVLVVVLFILKPTTAKTAASLPFPYVKQQALFTPAERSFLGMLDLLLNDQYRIMGKVRIADVITVASHQSRAQWQSAFNRINAKHFDFVLCDTYDLSPIAVIELDDKSHDAKTRQLRDDFLTGVCDAAALPLIRIPARRVYTRSDVERLVVRRLSPFEESPTAPIQPSPAPVTRPQEPPVESAKSMSPTCPKCASEMMLRRVKKGARAGQSLWGCRQYPQCRAILPVKSTSAVV